MSKNGIATKEEVAPTVKPRAKPFDPRRLHAHNFGWQVLQFFVPPDITHEQLMDGDCWRLCAPRIRRGDKIEWLKDDLTARGELICVSSDMATGNIEVRELVTQIVQRATVPETEKCGFTPRDLGLHEGWAIFRDSDDKMLKKNIRSYDEAMRLIRVEMIPNQIGQVTAGHIR